MIYTFLLSRRDVSLLPPPATSRTRWKRALLSCILVVAVVGAVIGGVSVRRSKTKTVTAKNAVILSDGSVRYVVPTESSKIAEAFVEYDNSKMAQDASKTTGSLAGDKPSSVTGKSGL